MLPPGLKKSVETYLTRWKETTVEIVEAKPVGGGCINETLALKTRQGMFFIKYNSSAAYPGMFGMEAAGLKILAGAAALTVPEVVGYGESGEYSYLLLQYIESGKTGTKFWTHFGTKLTELHRNTTEFFGLDHDNYIGSLVQLNKHHPDFISFFIEQRIEPQLREARNKGALEQRDMRSFNSLFKTLQNIIPVEKPSLLHGDLWSGNFMVTSAGLPCLVDPAVYYGHREADIAMTALFGGFHPEFYEAVNETWPMEKGWQDRIDIFNLYPLLVHVNLFGGGYAGQVMQIIRQF